MSGNRENSIHMCHSGRKRKIFGLKQQRSKQMNIKTKYLGELQIEEKQIIHFPNGLLGFENNKDFILLDVPDNEYFKFLQDINNSYICFLLVNPWDFYDDYDVELSDEELLKIEIEHDGKEQLSVLTIVTLEENFKDSTTNLLAPIVVNLPARKGKQFVLNDSIYATKHRLFPEGTGE